MSDCIHFDDEKKKPGCAIFDIPCDNPSHETKGCYMSITERDAELQETWQKANEGDPIACLYLGKLGWKMMIKEESEQEREG